MPEQQAPVNNTLRKGHRRSQTFPRKEKTKKTLFWDELLFKTFHSCPLVDSLIDQNALPKVN
jgi:hypothetical protein